MNEKTVHWRRKIQYIDKYNDLKKKTINSRLNMKWIKKLWAINGRKRKPIEIKFKELKKKATNLKVRRQHIEEKMFVNWIENQLIIRIIN